MELKEIKEIVVEILSDIEKNTQKYTYRKMETFLTRIGMDKKRNFKILAKFDYQFSKNNLSLWRGKDLLKSITQFRKNETVTFRVDEKSAEKQAEKKSGKVNYKFAGKINILPYSESGITLYEHQEIAFYNLQEKIIKYPYHQVQGGGFEDF